MEKDKEVYEEYSFDKRKRFKIFKQNDYYQIVIEEYLEEQVIMGYIQPAGFYEVEDHFIHNTNTIKDGIHLGRELIN